MREYDQTARLPDVATNLATVKAAIAAAAVKAGRDPEVVRLVAVSKTKNAEAILPALSAGQRTFGENRVQEARDKWPPLKERFSDVRLHLIGPLQTNKVRHALGLFDVIETVDRESLAEALSAAMNRTGHRPDCLVQVNTGHEPQKAGVAPEQADAFIAACLERWGLPITGLMCIPPVGLDPAPHFALLASIAARNGLSVLSMGMSDDFEIAVRMGATHVRVGSAIFGAR